MPRFTRENVELLKSADGWKSYLKTVPTRMMRMTGPFSCVTKEGEVECEDGFLALDAEGFPYPIAKSIHDKTYKIHF